MSPKSLFLGLILALYCFSPGAAAADKTSPAPENTPAEETTAAGTTTADTTGTAISETTTKTTTDDTGASGTDADVNAAAHARDVIVVLDNSGSMKKNDPEFLAREAVKEFVSRLEQETRLGIIIFGQDVQLAMPLTHISGQSREQIADSLEQIDYKGLFTDSPAAIERAIYELKNNGREDAQKFIVFMTDGIVDTGNADKDLEKTRWLREDLAPDAADSDIRIFGIAFTQDADFQLIQSLAQKTDGEYYRALKPEDLQSVFGNIQKLMQKPPEKPATEPKPEAEPEQSAQPPPPQQPVVINVPKEPIQSMGEEERIRNIIILVSAAVLILALIIIIVLLIRHNKGGRGSEDAFAAEAFLNDIHGHTSQSTYRMGNKPTMLGRVAGKDTDHLDYIVIPQSTIGRRHALIEYKDFAYWIVDQGSINGTYVNDMPISSEVRLKHGDKIRLHKLEFEFIMPEMDEAGMTEMSSTVFAQQGSSDRDEVTALREGASRAVPEDAEPDFDISEDEGSTAVPEDEEDTVLQESDGSGSSYGDDDDTLLPGSEDSSTDEKPTQPADGDEASEDETLMPGEFDFPDEDETLRRDSSDESLEDFFDLTDLDKDEKNRDKDGD